MRARTLFGAITVLALAAVAERPARACGGCFHHPVDPSQATVVTGHQMAFSISPTQTTLWDQIEYAGSPSDFAWVLPVRPGATIQLAQESWFAALAALTDPVITGPSTECGGGGGASVLPGCGSSNGNTSAEGDFGADDAGGPGGSGVQVLSQSVVGPYQTVTLQSSNPTALVDWLDVNQYEVPTAMAPVIKSYVDAGFDFIALRLAPGEGVKAMQPVRVTSPGAGLTLPLRMVEAGVGANVGIVLYVIGDGRYQAANFPNAFIANSRLVWLSGKDISNYQTVAAQLMAGDSGRTWLTEYAEPSTLEGTPTYTPASYGCTPGVADEDAGSAGGGSSTAFGSNLAALYYAGCQCVPDGSCDAQGPSEGYYYDGGYEGTGSGNGADAGACTACSAYDDLQVASAGLDPAGAWVTRMRAELPSSALLAADLSIGASPSQTPVSSNYSASVYDDPTYNPCGNGAPQGDGTSAGSGCSTLREDPTSGQGLVLGVLGVLAVGMVKRRRGGT